MNTGAALRARARRRRRDGLGHAPATGLPHWPGRAPLCTQPPGLRPTRRLSDACAAQAEGPQVRLPTEDATERRLALRGSPTPGAPHLVVQVEEVGVLLPDVGLGVGDELADVPVGTRGGGVPLCGRSPRRTMTREPHPPGGPPAEPGAAESRAGPGTGTRESGRAGGHASGTHARSRSPRHGVLPGADATAEGPGAHSLADEGACGDVLQGPHTPAHALRPVQLQPRPARQWHSGLRTLRTRPRDSTALPS